METAVIRGIGELLLYNRYYGTVIEVEDNLTLGAWIFHPMVEGNRDRDRGLFPSGVSVQPFIRSLVKIIVCQLAIDIGPFGLANIVWLEVGVTNNGEKFFKAFPRFLDAMVPIPVP